ncbi:alpha/beta fold hydrolase [Neobacillus terrae]|uniref:alpha/beta fold hydrolase n=1 Tax=Neobacillus terrae TaxID=3034837 RepID=UPI00140B5946|nr:alpha/beta hydrolase [Neobacillus terrae]NHM32007.1 alpha/beta hydrolase [Neobacillus terrae]
MAKCLIRDSEIYYQEFGEGKPVICIHGFVPDSRVMIGCMEPFFKDKEGYRRIYLDLPGMGKTKGSENINNTDDMLDVVIQFIETIIPGESFLLAGESYGGYLARGVIAKMKEKVDGAAFICPVIIPEISKRSLPHHMVIYEDKEFMKTLSQEDQDGFRSLSVILDEYVCTRYKNEVLSGSQIADEEFLEKIKKNYGFTFDLDDFFERPSLFLVGRQDAVTGYKDAFNIIERYPRATFAVLDKASHNLQIEQDTLFNHLMGEWLDRVSKGVR